MTSFLRIALRNVLRNRRRSLITLSAVFLALGVMVGVRGFLNGLQATIRESVVFGQTGALQVHRKGFLKAVTASPLELDLPATDAFLAAIRAVPGVTAAAARIAFGGMANANDTTSFALFTAIDPRREPDVCPRRMETISSGKPLSEAPRGAGLLTPELAGSLGVKLGDKVTLLAGDKDGVLNALELDFVGVYGQSGLPLPDKKLGFVPLALAQEILRMPGRATEIAVAVARIDDVEAVKPRLQAAVGPDYEVSSWHDVAAFVDEAIAAQNTTLNILAGIFLFVALLGIANTMLMSVFERTREIGTMMAVGVRRRQILGLFLLEAALLGLMGGALGAAAGVGLVRWLASGGGLSIKMGSMTAPLHVHPSVTLGYIGFVLALAAGGATLAALWPSLRASRLRPIEALGAV